MQTNQLPRYDQSDNPTGCCPRFNPAGWDGQDITLAAKPFARATTRSLFYIPLNMGGVFSRVLGKMAKADAADADNYIVLSRDLSKFRAEHLFATRAPVPGEEMTTLSGQFITKLFEGPYSQMGQWCDALHKLAEDRGKTAKSLRYFYTTCPKCAKAYGKNYVVGFVEV